MLVKHQIVSKLTASSDISPKIMFLLFNMSLPFNILLPITNNVS